MKKSNLYLIYALLFFMIANIAENRLVIGLTITCAALCASVSLILPYFEDKNKHN